MALRVLVLFLLALFLPASQADEAQSWRVVFPNLHLAKNREFVEKIQLVVECGHIESVSAIPTDWSITIVRMISAVEELHAEAGHGASRLPALGKFNGGVRVTPLDTNCFSLSAKILVSGENDREIELSRSKVRLIP